MKRTVINILLCAAALMFGISCSKTAETGIIEPQLEEFSLSATLTVPGGDTKVALGGDQGLSPLWKTDDTILVLDANMKPVGPEVFTLTSGADSKHGTFSGKKYFGQTPTYAIYPESAYDATTGKFTLPVAQDGTKASAFKDNAVMLGKINKNGNAFTTTFANVCSVLKINTGDYGKSGGDPAIKSVKVSAASGLAGEFTIDWTGATPTISPATDGTASNSVTAEATSESGFATGTDIYIPIIPASSQTFDFEFTDRIGRSGNLSGELKAAARMIKDLGKAGGVDFSMPIILPGKFTVGENKTVQFSSGNLYWDGSKFLFEKRQWESTPSSDGYLDPSHVSHFFWSKTKSVAYAPSYSDSGAAASDVFFTNDPTDAEKANPDFTVNGETGKYRTLSITEWQYLFNTRDDASSKYGLATVAGVHGIIILPDGEFQDPMKNNGSEEFVPGATKGWYTNTYTPGGSWEAMEIAGAVFLPIAGGRWASFVENDGSYGGWWSSSANGRLNAYNVGLDSDGVYPDNYGVRDGSGYSVRLITDCQ